jgi:hypothetical protein
LAAVLVWGSEIPTKLPPAALRRSRPERNALSTARYRSNEKIIVSLTLIPSAKLAVIHHAGQAAGQNAWAA